MEVLNMINDPLLLSFCCPCEYLLYSCGENTPLQREDAGVIEE